MVKAHQGQALEEVRKEHAPYFEAIETHPRLLVGKNVPALDGSDREETLKSEDDAKSWQEAVKHQLAAEVRGRASKAMDEQGDFLTTIHSSIELFQTNADLVPGTKEFDVDLANRFVTLVKPYELRVEGKLQGWSIPVQPIIEQLRGAITSERATAAASPAAVATAAAAGPPAAAASPPAAAGSPPEQPQAGIQSKAGSGSEKEDFSTLFGTLGLPDFQI